MSNLPELSKHNRSQASVFDQFYSINLGERELKNFLDFRIKSEPPFESWYFQGFEWKVGPCCLLMGLPKGQVEGKDEGW